MAIRSTEFKVGLTVILAVAMLAWGIIWVKGYRYGHEVTRYQATFENVGALATGDPVAINGVTKGKVVGLTLAGGEVLVTMELDKAIELKSDATFTVKNIGLMGERYIEIYPGKSTAPLSTAEPSIGRFDTGIPEVMGMMGQMITEVRDLVQVLSTSVQGAPESFRRADSTVTDLRATARLLADLLTENRKRIDNAASDMEAGARTLRTTIQGKSSQFDSTLDRMSVASDKILSAAGKFDSLSNQLQRLAGQVEAGEGTLGALVQDPSLYDDLKRAAAEIDALVADIRANPKKYVRVNLSIF
jgi:phospholipid/cholesterol/gamma-HCH transport system substrate-binding protein